MLRNQYLSAKTLAEFKSFQSLDVLDLDPDPDTSNAPLFIPKVRLS